MKKIGIFWTLCSSLLVLLLNSCDPFILGPTLNLNRDDINESFGRLECEVIDNDEIRVIWDWYDLERLLRDSAPVYDELVIKHNRGSYPASRLGGRSFSISSWDPSSNPLSSAVFSDLKGEREHYFALYAHEAGGTWMAPVYESCYLERTSAHSPLPLSVDDGERDNAIGGDIDTGSFFHISTGTSQTISDTAFNIFYYNPEDLTKTRSAELNVYVESVPIEATLVVHPMRRVWTGIDSREIRTEGAHSYVVDRSIQAEYSLSAGTTGPLDIDISQLFTKLQYHRTGGIFIYSRGNSITLDYDEEDFRTIEVVEIREVR